MKIVADQNMPLVKEMFGHFGEVQLMSGREIYTDVIADAEMLLVRSVTEVNENLLSGSSIRFVGSATAGIDHIDTNYLTTNNIHFAYAPGCNAQAVVEYVLSCLCRLCPDWRDKLVGIVGCGHVGRRLYQCMRALGVATRVFDPFMTPESISDLCTFDDLLDCDIISLHTPLTVDGPYPTYHLFDADCLDQLKAGTILINSSRGAVVDNCALLDTLSSGKNLRVALDVWEGEPKINGELLGLVAIATPHIAGYSDEGKLKGTTMLLEAAQSFYASPNSRSSAHLMSEKPIQLDLDTGNFQEAILACYDVQNDDQMFRQAVARNDLSIAEIFDRQRKGYPSRNEFSHYSVSKELPCSQLLCELGFIIL